MQALLGNRTWTAKAFGQSTPKSPGREAAIRKGSNPGSPGRPARPGAEQRAGSPSVFEQPGGDLLMEVAKSLLVPGPPCATGPGAGKGADHRIHALQAGS